MRDRFEYSRSCHILCWALFLEVNHSYYYHIKIISKSLSIQIFLPLLSFVLPAAALFFGCILSCFNIGQFTIHCSIYRIPLRSLRDLSSIPSYTLLLHLSHYCHIRQQTSSESKSKIVQREGERILTGKSNSNGNRCMQKYEKEGDR